MIMKLILRRNLRLYPLFALIVVACTVAAVLLHANAFLIGPASLLLAFSLFVKIEFSKKINGLFIIPIFIFCAIIVFLLMQFTIGAGIGKRLNVVKFSLNVLVIFAIEALVFAACRNMRASILSALIFSEAIAVIDHLVVQTRSMEIGFNDIFSIMTGLSVAAGYSFTLSRMTLTALYFSIGFGVLIALTSFPDFKGTRLRLFTAGGGVGSLLLVILLVSTAWGERAIGFVDKYWMFRASENNGFYVNVIHTATATKVRIPSGYSPEELEALLSEYNRLHGKPSTSAPSTDVKPPVTTPPTTGGKPTTTPPSTDTPDIPPTTDEKKPNIIVIMDETFTDLQAVAEYLYKNGYAKNQLLTVEDVLPFYRSLSSDMPNVEKGWALSSVFGGNTANSEFEFLTGHSMAFLPKNTVAYNLYLNKNNSFSIVDALKKAGYTTVGMHPEAPINWSRDKIYSYYGFDNILFKDDFTGLTDEDYYRGHVSDSAVFRKIIELYESKDENTPLFTFAVTMMNHGGYSTENFESIVHIKDFPQYTGTQEYLSSIKKTDEALKELIEYFSSADEETMIVFFGDHQPSLSGSFYSRFFGIGDDTDTKLNQAKYAVPYMIWANFEFEDDSTEITSINYLSGKMFDIAGLEKTEYLKFISTVRRDYLAITAAGYFDNDMNFYSFADVLPYDSNLLRIYKYLQYNALFDKVENKLVHWFVLQNVGTTGNESQTTTGIGTLPEPVTAPPTPFGKEEPEI